MADVTTNTFLSKAGLIYYDEKIKAWAANADLAAIASAVAQAKTYTDSKDATITAAQTAADNAQSAADKAQEDVDNLSEYVGTIPTGATATDVVGYIQEKTAGIATDAALEELTNRVAGAEGEIDAIQADYMKKADKDALQSSIDANADAIDILNGTGDGSVAKQIDDAFNDFSTKVTDDAVVNSYKELIDWAADHGGEAAEMAAAIEANEQAISGLQTLIGAFPEGVAAKTVVALIQELVAAEETRATAAEEALATRIGNLETKMGSTSVADQISAAKEEAVEEAKSYTDSEIDKVEVTVSSNTGKITTLEGQVGTLKTDLDAAEEDIDALQTAVDETLPASIADAKKAGTAAQAAAEQAQSEVDELEKTVKALDGEVDKNTAAISTNAENISSVSDRVTELESVEWVEIATTEIDSMFA